MLLNVPHPPAILRHPAAVGGPLPRRARARVSAVHYDGIAHPGWLSWVGAALVSLAIHSVIVVGPRHHAPPARHVVADAPMELMMMPDLKEPEDPPPPELRDEEPTAPAVEVPSLADVPVSVSIDSSFVQSLEITTPPNLDAAVRGIVAIPVHIQHGRGDGTGMKDLFNLSDLDRRPEAIMQMPPTFPPELKESVSEAQVMVHFVVTSKGEVTALFIVSSTHRGFERAAIEAVGKWRFKPGIREGRKVNTRVEQLIRFSVLRATQD